MKPWYILKITHIDLRQVPPLHSVSTARRLQLTDKEATELRQKARTLFDAHSNGNDEAYELVLEKIEEADIWTLLDADWFLAEFARNNDLSYEPLSPLGGISRPGN